MDEKTITGKITFINHDKNKATIEYERNGKKKTISGDISEEEQLNLREQKIIKKVHRFHVGDEVSFIIAPSARGDKMIADCLQFRYNNALNDLINKSAVEKYFVGYLKKVEGKYFVKEAGSYIFFPLILSPWEKKPLDTNLNEPVFFKLQNIEKADKINAVLYKSEYSPEYRHALQCFKNKTVLNTVVYKVTPHGVFVNVVGETVQAKIIRTKENDGALEALKTGDPLKVIITYLNTSKIVVALV